MSFNEVLEELPALTVEQRQQVVRRALELDEPPLTPADEAQVEERLLILSGFNLGMPCCGQSCSC